MATTKSEISKILHSSRLTELFENVNFEENPDALSMADMECETEHSEDTTPLENLEFGMVLMGSLYEKRLKESASLKVFYGDAPNGWSYFIIAENEYDAVRRCKGMVEFEALRWKRAHVRSLFNPS